MTIIIKNKDTLLIDEFKFKCCIGKNGIKKNKIEGDLSTPKGNFGLEDLYYRKDKLSKPITRLQIKEIKRNFGWCTDNKSNLYNKRIINKKELKHEKLFRKDYKYDLLIIISYNRKKIIKDKGSAIFLHLTKDYKPTAGCIGLKKKDFLILLKLINKKTKIVIR
tara:strand:+ start:1336 stop:1827 length:492 start_codon:yes stop_codon:yes gene_type:complete